jgi:hypothetical protein
MRSRTARRWICSEMKNLAICAGKKGVWRWALAEPAVDR